MPLYEYQCKKCHSLTERIQKFSDQPLTICPHCGGELEQLLSAPSVRFKGSGWYATDYAKKASSSGAAGDNGSTSESSSDGKPGADSKAETAKTDTSSSKDTSSKGK